MPPLCLRGLVHFPQHPIHRIEKRVKLRTVFQDRDELLEILDGTLNLFQIVNREVIEKPRLQLIEVDAVIHIVAREQLRLRCVARRGIVRRR